MGEKLNAFISFYSSKAKEEVEKWKNKTTEDEVKWKKLTDEIYPAALKTATDLKQVETFQQVFPSPGIFVENITKYGTLLGVDTEFEKQLKELYKWRNTKTQIANRKKYLAQAETYVEKGGEDYISRLSHEIFSKAADAASRGAKFDSIIDQLLKSYPEYTEFLEDLIDPVPGPDGVLITPETYAALLEKKEAGAFTFKTKENETKSPTETKPEGATEKKAEASTEKKVETSPINSGEKAKTTAPSGEPKPGESSAINAGTEKKTESTSVTSAEGQVTSKTGELTKEEPKSEGKPSTAINVNLEAAKTPSESKTEKEKTESATILNTNEKVEKSEKILEKTAESTEVKSTTSSVNTETAKEPQESTSSSGAVNQPKEEKKKGGFLSKLGKISNAIGSALNLPTFKELGSQAAGLFGATGAKFMSNVSDIKQSFAKNSINSNVNQKKETSDNTTSTTSNESNVSSSNTSSTIDNTQNATMNLEKNSPSMTAENTSTAVSNQTNTGGNQMQSSTNTSTSPTTTTSTSNQTILQPTPTAQSPSQGQQMASPSPGTSVDLSSLAQSISRLEKILISGIEVTIKDT